MQLKALHDSDDAATIDGLVCGRVRNPPSSVEGLHADREGQYASETTLGVLISEK